MISSNQLDCKVYLQSDKSKPALIALLLHTNQFILGQFTWSESTGAFQGSLGDMELRTNDDADDQKAGLFPDGFLCFRHVLEFYPYSHIQAEDRTKLIASLLQGLWDQGISAVAACAYEEQLPRKGGYGVAVVNSDPHARLPGIPPKPTSAANLSPLHHQ